MKTKETLQTLIKIDLKGKLCDLHNKNLNYSIDKFTD
jgi:hypothetical protein